MRLLRTASEQEVIAARNPLVTIFGVKGQSQQARYPAFGDTVSIAHNFVRMFVKNSEPEININPTSA